MVSAKQYVGAPIQCWMPTEFKGGWEQYAEDYCFIQNTYFVHFAESIPEEIDERSERELGYYQWVPVVLALQAILFYLPNWIWKTLHQHSGLDMTTAINDARRMRSLHCEERRTEMSRLTHYLSESLEINLAHRVPTRVLFFRIGRGLGSYVSMLYLIVKALYLVNIFGQFILMNNFLNNHKIGSNYSLWGFSVIKDLWYGQEWQESNVFPRVTLCDFQVRRLANIHRYTVQCVLMINMFNEKIYLFIWFWFLFVAVSTIINFIYCVATLVPPRSREKTLKQLLKQDRLQDAIDAPENAQVVHRFANYALRPDGVLLLRFIEGHAGAIVARDLCANLFAEYVKGLDYRASHLRVPGSQSTKSTSPGGEDAYHEGMPLHPPNFYPEKIPRGLNEPDFHGTPKGKGL
uniref:Innexin n=1 Tax=Acrobeloides nanus TaxID=290746 RepID=A0A914DV40_9BILA